MQLPPQLGDFTSSCIFVFQSKSHTSSSAEATHESGGGGFGSRNEEQLMLLVPS